MALVRECQTLVLVGETGSGKTTQLPQFILQDGLAQVSCQSHLCAGHFWAVQDVPTVCRVHAGRMHCCDAAKARGSHSCRCARRQGDGRAAGRRGTSLRLTRHNLLISVPCISIGDRVGGLLGAL